MSTWKEFILYSLVYVPMPTIWLIILHFFVKSNYWKKFFLYLGFIFLLIASLPIVSTFFGKFFYSDNYKMSNHNKKPAYVLVPGAGTVDVAGKNSGYKFPTPETIKRSWYGHELSKQHSIPLIFAGGGDAFLAAMYFENLPSLFYKGWHIYSPILVTTESATTLDMAINLKKIINVSDGPLLLATNPVHHRRTILALKSQNFDVLIPDNYLKNRKISYSIIPSVNAIIGFNEIIYESLGIVWYYFKGKI